MSDEADQLFAKIDADGDGRISDHELLVHLLGQGQDDHTISELFRELDLDGSGYIEWNEFEAGYGKMVQAAKGVSGPRSAPKRRGFGGWSGVDELGQTNSAVVGKNFLSAFRKATREKQGKRPRHITQLAELGFHRVAERLEDFPCSLRSPDEQRIRCWEEMARVYTMEESGDVDAAGNPKVLYRELNWALRTDDKSLDKWATYMSLLFFGGDGEFTSSLAPRSALPSRPQTTYRGFSMEPGLASRYPKGAKFFWQTFVSTSKIKEQSLDFARASCAAGNAPFLFVIDLPAYKQNGQDPFWMYDLSSVSHFIDESEVLLIPYSQFEVVEPPRLGSEGVHLVHIKLVQQPLVMEPEHVTVWVDPAGFDSGSNRELSAHAFDTSMPKFRRRKEPRLEQWSFGTLYDYAILGGNDSLALFSDSDAALKFIKEQLEISSTIIFKLVCSGAASEAFIGGYLSSHASTPCEVLVFCGNEAKWRDFWTKRLGAQIQVTSSPTTLKQYIEFKTYDAAFDRDIKLEEDSDVVRARKDDAVVFYAWRSVKGGVIYGGCGPCHSYAQNDEGKRFTQAATMINKMHMAPYEHGTLDYDKQS